MMSPRAFLGVIGAFTLIGALVWLWSPITLQDTDVEGKAVACGDGFSSDSGNAAVADQPNEMGRTPTESRYFYPDRGLRRRVPRRHADAPSLGHPLGHRRRCTAARRRARASARPRIRQLRTTYTHPKTPGGGITDWNPAPPPGLPTPKGRPSNGTTHRTRRCVGRRPGWNCISRADTRPAPTLSVTRSNPAGRRFVDALPSLHPY